MTAWSDNEIKILRDFYPTIGKEKTAEMLGRSVHQVRSKAHRLGIKQDISSEFFKEWQERAASSKVGKKRPDQALVMKKLHADGKLIKTEEQRKAMSVSRKKWFQENPHPRGALGMKHSVETLKVLSKKSKSMWERMPEDMRDQYSKRAALNGLKQNMNRANASWKAAWREIGGKKKYFRSRWEANYARYLEWLKQNNQIAEWEHEPETFWFEGIKRGCLSYLPDFKVTELNGNVSYHEVKGWMDDRSKTKIKRMAKYHPDIKLVVIDSSAYKRLQLQLKAIIKDWE